MKDPKLARNSSHKLRIVFLLVAGATALELTPLPQEYSSERKYVDMNPRVYYGTVGDSKEHILKCYHGHKGITMAIYFVVPENADPSTRAVLATIPNLGQFYIEYYKPTEFYLTFEFDNVLQRMNLPKMRQNRVYINKWVSLLVTYDSGDRLGIYLDAGYGIDIVKSKKEHFLIRKRILRSCSQTQT